MKPLTGFLKDVEKEFAYATTKFPGNKDQIVALMEEVGELANALLDLKHGELKCPTVEGHCTEIWKEAVQVASMAAKIAILGDENFPQYDSEYAAIFSKSHYKQ